MKKIYSALTFMAIGATAFAVNPASMSYKLTEADMARLSASLQESAVRLENGADVPTKAWEDASGNVWLLSFVKVKNLGGYFSGEPTLEEYPYYGVETIIRKQNMKTGDITDELGVLLVWPTKYAYEHLLDENYTGTKDYSPVDWNVFMDNAVAGKNAKGFQVRLSAEGGTYFVTPNAAQTEIETFGMFLLGFGNGDKGKIGATPLPADASLSNGASLIVKSKEDDPDGVIYNFDGNLKYSSGQTCTFGYNGTVKVQGFEGVTNRMEIDKVTLYNAGIIDPETDENEVFFPYDSYKPLQMVYFAVNGAGVQTSTRKQDDNNYTFGVDKVGCNFLQEGYNFAPAATFNFVRGMLFFDTAGFNIDKPFGVFNMVTPEEKNGRYTVNPVANMILPVGMGTNGWSGTLQLPKYGVSALWNQYYTQLVAPTKIAVGTTKGFEMDATDKYGSRIVIACADTKAKLFKDAKDMTQYHQISVVGDIDFSGVETVVGDEEVADVKAGNGVITVNATSDANVYVYALNGAMINATNVKAGQVKNIAVEKGAYVVKVGKKATKVIL